MDVMKTITVQFIVRMGKTDAQEDVHFEAKIRHLPFLFFFLVKGNPGKWNLWTLQRVPHLVNGSLWKAMRQVNQMTNSTQRRRFGRNCRCVSSHHEARRAVFNPRWNNG